MTWTRSRITMDDHSTQSSIDKKSQTQNVSLRPVLWQSHKYISPTCARALTHSILSERLKKAGNNLVQNQGQTGMDQCFCPVLQRGGMGHIPLFPGPYPCSRTQGSVRNTSCKTLWKYVSIWGEHYTQLTL